MWRMDGLAAVRLIWSLGVWGQDGAAYAGLHLTWGVALIYLGRRDSCRRSSAICGPSALLDIHQAVSIPHTAGVRDTSTSRL